MQHRNSKGVTGWMKLAVDLFGFSGFWLLVFEMLGGFQRRTLVELSCPPTHCKVEHQTILNRAWYSNLEWAGGACHPSEEITFRSHDVEVSFRSCDRSSFYISFWSRIFRNTWKSFVTFITTSFWNYIICQTLFVNYPVIKVVPRTPLPFSVCIPGIGALYNLKFIIIRLINTAVSTRGSSGKLSTSTKQAAS